jgi:hypothetical protein
MPVLHPLEETRTTTASDSKPIQLYQLAGLGAFIEENIKLEALVYKQFVHRIVVV